MKLYFKNKFGEYREIVDVASQENALEYIRTFCEERNYHIYYTRTYERDGFLIFDVGSHTESFELELSKDREDEISATEENAQSEIAPTFRKSDLKTGMIVTTITGEKWTVYRDMVFIYDNRETIDALISQDKEGWIELDDYDDDLNFVQDDLTDDETAEFEIIKVEMPTSIYQIIDPKAEGLTGEPKVLFDKHPEGIDETEDEPFEFVWGIKSWDDLTGAETANNYTMNDFDIVRDKESGEYIFSIETIFAIKKDEQKRYLQYILDKFTDWMKSQDYNTDYDLSYYEAFSKERSDSIEECYAKFKMLVNGFCGEY